MYYLLVRYGQVTSGYVFFLHYYQDISYTGSRKTEKVMAEEPYL